MDFLTPGIDFSGEKLSPGVVILTKMAKILDLEFFEYFPTVKKGRGRNGILCHQAAWRRHIEFVGISLICQKPLRNLVHSDILDSICASYPSNTYKRDLMENPLIGQPPPPPIYYLVLQYTVYLISYHNYNYSCDPDKTQIVYNLTHSTPNLVLRIGGGAISEKALGELT